IRDPLVTGVQTCALPISEIRTYLPGEAVVHQGDQGEEMFFILEGHAEVRIGEGTDSVLATLNPLQFFGEMSLLTGERRSATIVEIGRASCRERRDGQGWT